MTQNNVEFYRNRVVVTLILYLLFRANIKPVENDVRRLHIDFILIIIKLHYSSYPS